MRSKISTQDLFNKAQVGLGATHHCGSDSYGCYICYVDPKTKTIGTYTPKHWFEKSWTDGSMKHEPFDPAKQPTDFYQAFRGHWYVLDRVTGTRRGRYSLTIGYCSFYQDPAF